MSTKDLIEMWKQKPLKEVLIELYIDQDLSMQKVADELKVSVGIIHKWLKDLSISKNNDLF